MKIAYLADANLHYGIVLGLRKREPLLDIMSANDADLTGIDDQQVLATAARLNRILVTSDRKTMPTEFGVFMARSRSSPGVFLISQRLPIAAAIDELLLIWAASVPLDWQDRLCSLPLSRGH